MRIKLDDAIINEFRNINVARAELIVLMNEIGARYKAAWDILRKTYPEYNFGFAQIDEMSGELLLPLQSELLKKSDE